MGDIADGTLDGTLCQSCGEYIGDPIGFPVTCAACGGDAHEALRTSDNFLRTRSQLKRAYNRKASRRLLDENEIEYVVHNDGAHIVIEDRIDFWPGTGRWIVRKTGRKARGVNNLIRHLTRTGGAR